MPRHVLEDEKGDLSEVEVYEVSGFMRDIGTKITSDNNMPCRAKPPVKFLLDICSDVLRKGQPSVFEFEFV